MFADFPQDSSHMRFSVDFEVPACKSHHNTGVSLQGEPTSLKHRVYLHQIFNQQFHQSLIWSKYEKSLPACLSWRQCHATFVSCEILDPGEPGQLVPLTVDEDPTLPSISVNGTQLHAETFGNPTDPMLVILHGGPGGD